MTALRGDALARLLDEPVDWRFKGFPAAEGVTVGTVGEQHWNLLAGDLLMPSLVLKERSLAWNVELVARWCDDHRVLHAPHGKTPMAPQLWERQLASGAWAISVATVAQARVCRAFGVPRLFLANELVEPAALRWLRAELAADGELDVLCLVDSVAGVERMADELGTLAAPVQVLVEVGYPGGRGGCRTLEEALEIGTAVRRAPGLVLAGVEGYEAGPGRDRSAAGLAAVDAFLGHVVEVARTLDREGLLDGRERPILSAGGSAFFDRAAEILGGGALGRPADVVVRPGAYIAHDDAGYRALSPLGAELEPALELWGVVLSRPEPDLAIVGFGRRDAPFDSGLPSPHAVCRDGDVRETRALEVTALNDQHAFVRVGAGEALAVGDLVGCGIAHPCTAFDKWRLLPVVDDAYAVVDAVATFF